jgi:hypothetical protein
MRPGERRSFLEADREGRNVDEGILRPEVAPARHDAEPPVLQRTHDAEVFPTGAHLDRYAARVPTAKGGQDVPPLVETAFPAALLACARASGFRQCNGLFDRVGNRRVVDPVGMKS